MLLGDVPRMLIKFCRLMELLSSFMNVGWEVAQLLLSSGKDPDSSFFSL